MSNLRNNIKFLLRDSVVYGASAALGKSLSILTLPLIIKSIVKVEYGLYDLVLNITALLTSLIVFGMDSAVARYFQPSRDKKKRIQILSTGFFLQLIFIIFYVPILFLFGLDIFKIYHVGENYNWVWPYIVFNSVTMSLLNFSTNFLKWDFKRTHFLILNLGNSLGFSIALLFFYFFKHLDFKLLITLNLCISCLFAFLGLFFIRNNLEFSFDKPSASLLLKYSIPLGITVVFLSISPSIDRYFISTLLGLSDLATYSVAVKLSFVLAFISSAFQIAWGPFSLKLLSEPNRVETFNFILKMLVYILIFLMFVIFLVSKPLILILSNNSYLEASLYIMPICLGLIIQNFGWITEIGITFSEKAKFFTFINLFSLIITIFLLFILVPFFGLNGISYSYLLGVIVRVFMTTYFSLKLFPMQWDLKIPIFLILFAFLVSIFFSIFQFQGMYFYIIVSFILLLYIYIGFNWLLNSTEQKSLLNMYRKLIKYL